MASTGFKAAGTGASVNTGSNVWANPGRVTADDGSYTLADEESSATSDTLRCTNFDFSSIPGGSTILGIEVRFNRFVDGTNAITSTSFQLVLAGTSEGTAKTTSVDWHRSLTSETLGGAADLWGDTPTTADVQTSTWGVDIAVTWDAELPAAGKGANVDFVEMNVHYAGTANYEQANFQGREDDGSESGATNIGSADADWTQARNKNFRVRFLIKTTVASELGFFYIYEQNLNGGAFTDISASTALRLESSAHFVQNEDTTDQGLGSGTFTSNNQGMRENVGLPDIFASLDTVVNEEWDAEICVMLNPQQVAGGDTVQIRIKGMDTYTNTPTITAASEVEPGGSAVGAYRLLVLEG